MPTFEVRCAVCGELKWPTLASRPERYTCVLCAMAPPGKRHQRLLASQKATETKRRRAASQPRTAVDAS